MTGWGILQETINGIRMSWRDEGTGDPILFLHAFPFHSGMWDAQLQALPAGWRGIAPDLRGFGATPGAGEGPYTMDLMADDVIALMDHLGLKHAAVCGLSMGGYVAMAVCRKTPKRIRGLILADTRATPDTKKAQEGRKQLAAKVRSEGARAVVEAMLPKLISDASRKANPDLANQVQQMMLSNPPESIARALEGIALRPSSEDVLRDIAVSVLIIHGEDDAIIPYGDAQMMARATRGAKLQPLVDTGHLANLEQPAAFNRHLSDFLEHLPPFFGSLKLA